MTDAYKAALAAITGRHLSGAPRLTDVLGGLPRGVAHPLLPRSPDQSAVPPASYARPDKQAVVEVFDPGLVAAHLALARILVHLAAQTADPGAWINREAALVDEAVDHLRDGADAPLDVKATETVRIALAKIYAVAKAGADTLP